MSNREYRRTYYLKHPERAKASSRAWQKQNAERERLRKKAWRAANPEKSNEHSRTWRTSNREKIQCYIRLKQLNLPPAASCELCPSTEDLERHHPDYDFPEIFVTACKLCHKSIHKGEDHNN